MLRSVKNQNYMDLEHIVVDAMSSDSTPEILSSYAGNPGVRVIREKDKGQSDGINKGVAQAQGEIISWLNSDDMLETGALHIVAQAFADFPSAIVICGVGSKTDRSGKILRTVPFRPFDPVRLRTALEFIQPATFIRRDAWNAVGGLDINLFYAMDWDLLIRLSRIGLIVSIPNRLAFIRYYEETKTSTGGWTRAAEIARIGRRHNGLLDLNHLSFRIRGATVGSPFLKRIVDWITQWLSEFRPIMVQGWPE